MVEFVTGHLQGLKEYVGPAAYPFYLWGMVAGCVAGVIWFIFGIYLDIKEGNWGYDFWYAALNTLTSALMGIIGGPSVGLGLGYAAWLVSGTIAGLLRWIF